MPRLVRPALAAGAASLAFALAALAGPPTGSAWTHDAYGSTAIFHMTTAPFPHPSRSYTDDRVMLLVPDGYRPGATVDLVIEYHGFRNEIVHSDAGHHYRQQLALSRKNAILVEPQGPYEAADGSGGKHDEKDGLARFVKEVLATLVREGVVPDGASPGKLVLAGHSGAYQVIAHELDHGGVEVCEVDLHDALYGLLPSFRSWASVEGHKLVSVSTRDAGTRANNATLRDQLESDGIVVATDESEASLAHARVVIAPVDVAHDCSTYARLRWADVLEHSALSDLSVPRPRLRSVRGAGAGTVEVAWEPVRSSLLVGYRLSSAPDPSGPFTVLLDETALGPSATSATVSPTPDAVYRVTAVDDQGTESPPTNVYAANPDGEARTRVLVVDGFCRTSGAWTSGDHPFAAVALRSVAAAGRACDACSARAVADGSVRLADYPSVVWLAGDQSVEDAALTHAEQAALASYLAQGGTLFLSGSELGYALAGSGSPEDRAFFSRTLHAAYVADASPSRTASGVASLLGDFSVAFGGAAAPYPVRFPDVLAAPGAASAAVRYGDGAVAAVAYEGTVGGTARAGVVTAGFPVESLDDAGGRDTLVAAVLGWLDQVNQRAGR